MLNCSKNWFTATKYDLICLTVYPELTCCNCIKLTGLKHNHLPVYFASDSAQTYELVVYFLMLTYSYIGQDSFLSLLFPAPAFSSPSSPLV